VTAEGENEFVNQQVLDYFGKSHEEVKGLGHLGRRSVFERSVIVCETEIFRVGCRRFRHLPTFRHFASS
jgi:hypothetical protein